MGVESGSQRILDAMDKGTTVDEVRQATRALRAHGIRACWFLQLGYPGETWEDLLATRDLVREERPDDIGVSVSYPLPGTKFHDLVRGQLGRTRTGCDSDDLAMLFQGTYTTRSTAACATRCTTRCARPRPTRAGPRSKARNGRTARPSRSSPRRADVPAQAFACGAAPASLPPAAAAFDAIAARFDGRYGAGSASPRSAARFDPRSSRRFRAARGCSRSAAAPARTPSGSIARGARRPPHRRVARDGARRREQASPARRPDRHESFPPSSSARSRTSATPPACRRSTARSRISRR